jgi:small-conductance mechanosensitive channel
MFGESRGDHMAAFAAQAEEELASREGQVARREGEVDAAEERLRRWSQRLRGWERELEVREQSAELMSKLSARTAETRMKVGRIERCPCGSSLMF